MKQSIISILAIITTFSGAIASSFFDNYHLGCILYGISILLLSYLVVYLCNQYSTLCDEYLKFYKMEH